MEETSQEKSDSNLCTPQPEESTDNKKPEIDKSESVDTDSTVPDHAEENTDELNSENGKSETEECSEHSGDESDDASVVLEREEGDGQESAPNRKVDDDEDKRNPQYIPKRGTFYEHDDRTAVDEEGEEGEKPEKERTEKEAKKKVWLEKEASKWCHDRFNDQEQAPKSRSELVAIYGYDIRNEDGPPRARRRRRYGRGPNKYTRNWEDEEAYSKPTNVSVKPVARKTRRTKGGEEFPPLGGDDNNDRENDLPEDVDSGAGGDNIEIKETTSINIENSGSGDVIPDSENDVPPPVRNAHPASKPKRAGNHMGPRHKEEVSRPSVNNNVRGVTKTRGFFKNITRPVDSTTRVRNQKNQQKPNQDDENSDFILSQNFTNKSHNNQVPQQQQQTVQKLEKDMANMSMQQHEFNGSGSGSGGSNRGGSKFGGGNNRQTSVPPRLQAEQRGSKRYSSLRQRSLPETAANPNFGQHPQYYPTGEFAPEYSGQPGGGGPTSGGAGLLPHPPPAGTTAPLLATNGAAHVMQAPFAQPYPQHPPPPPPAFLQPVQPAVQPFIPQQPPPPPQIINFAQPQAYPQPTYPNFQHQQFNPVNQGQPAELYQPQGGITYYSTQNQQVLPRVPQKRVKSAIPIVPPPEHKEPRGRGRLKGEDSAVGSAPEAPPEEALPHDATATTAPVIVQQ